MARLNRKYLWQDALWLFDRKKTEDRIGTETLNYVRTLLNVELFRDSRYVYMSNFVFFEYISRFITQCVTPAQFRLIHEKESKNSLQTRFQKQVLKGREKPVFDTSAPPPKHFRTPGANSKTPTAINLENNDLAYINKEMPCSASSLAAYSSFKRSRHNLEAERHPSVNCRLESRKADSRLRISSMGQPPLLASTAASSLALL